MTDLKTDLRTRAFAARKTAHAGGQGYATKHLLSTLAGHDVQIISGYMPIRTEIDPLPAMDALHRAGKTICVPVIVAAGQPLTFRVWTPDCVLEPGPFGAQVPRDGATVEPELLIAPLVAFDRAGNRLGYGGGFYDRTLEKLRAKRTTPAIGFAFAAQELELTPEPTDQPLDAIVTEAGVVVPAPAPR